MQDVVKVTCKDGWHSLVRGSQLRIRNEQDFVFISDLKEPGSGTVERIDIAMFHQPILVELSRGETTEVVAANAG